MKKSGQKLAHRVYLPFLGIIGFTILATFFLIWAYGSVPHRAKLSVNLIVDGYKPFMAPEPTEQFTFAVLAVLVPILALTISMLRRIGQCNLTNQLSWPLPVAIGTLLFFPFIPPFGSELLSTLLRDYSKPPSGSDGWSLLAALCVAAAWCMAFVKPRAWQLDLGRTHARLATFAVCLILGLAVFLQLGSWRLVSFASVLADGGWNEHADPIFYVLAQVVAGKTLLVDLPSQYGLFPEFLAPIFRLTGLSVASASAVFAIMQVVSLGALFYVLASITKSRVLLTVSGLAIILVTFETVIFFSGVQERYFQYWPLRFFWPALSVALFYRFSKSPTLFGSTVLSIIGGIALLWNMDSGLFVVVSFGAYLLSKAVALSVCSTSLAAVNRPWPARAYVAVAALHVLLTLAVIALFLGYLSLKSNEHLIYRWLSEYQVVFAALGLAMVPLPRTPDPWMSVLAIYLGAMLHAFNCWRAGTGSQAKADLLFYLGMLGLGLFVYYAGRSHVLNLVTVCWPAVMIVAIQSDELLRAIRAQLLPGATLAIPVVGVSILVLAGATFVSRTPFMFDKVAYQFKSRGLIEDRTVERELAFVKRLTEPGTECFIAAKRQGIYYAEAGLSSPVLGPGIVETVLKTDERRLLDSLYRGDFSCVFLGTGAKSRSMLPIDTTMLLTRYRVVEENELATMLYLVRN